MNFVDMQSRGRGFSPYRGRGGRGNILVQHGKQKLIASDLSHNADFQEFLEFKKQKAKSNTPNETSDTQSYAHIVSEENSQNQIDYIKNQSNENILYITETDLKWENDPWMIMKRYLDTASYAYGVYKPRYYYENLLQSMDSCEITHFGGQKDNFTFSKLIIKNIVTAEEWGISTLREKEFYYPEGKTPIKCNYWDYISAFNHVLLYENNNHRHSWFIKICGHIHKREMPNWFVKWWQNYGTTVKILPESWKSYFQQWVDISPQICDQQKRQICPDEISSLLFFVEFSIPWIWKWSPTVGYSDGIPCLKRNSYSKFWDKMLKTDPNTKALYGKDTLDLIQQTLVNYQAKQNDMDTPTSLSQSPFEAITRKLKMKAEPITKEKMVALYIEEMKKDLFSKLDDDISVKSDTSMNSEHINYFQDSQDPMSGSFEDIFEEFKETLLGNISSKTDLNKEASSSSKGKLP